MASPEPRGPHVLFVIGGLATGGSEQQLTTLVCHAHPGRLRATVLVLNPERTPRRRLLEEHGVRVIAVDRKKQRAPRHMALAAFGVARAIRAERPDVVYAWLEQSAVYAVPPARLLGIPVVVARRNVSGATIERRWAAARVVFQRAERAADLVTANSGAGRAFSLERGVRPERIRVVRNGVEASPPSPLPAPDPFVFGYVAGFRPEKGHRRLLAALERLQALAVDRDWRVRLAGTGALVDEVRGGIAERGLGGRVELVGPVDDVPGFWAGCHAAMLLSDFEGQPNALIEAALAGRPAIATDVGGTAEVVAPAGGVLVAGDDVAGAAAAMARYLADPAAAAADGVAARQQALDRFGLAASIDGHVAALLEAWGR